MCARCKELEYRIGELEAILGLDFEFMATGLNPAGARILGMLAKYPGRIWPRATLVAAYSRRSNPSDRSVDSLIKRLRMVIGKHGIEINSAYGEGYTMTAENAMKARAIFGENKMRAA